jgi:hypothetical protein
MVYVHIIIFIFFIAFTQIINSANLNELSIKRIKYIIKHPETTHDMRYQINNVLFEHYKNWATTKAFRFKHFHKHKCYHIPNDEIISLALFGLYKGIQKYNGNDTFIIYVDFHIKASLYDGMTKLLPMNKLKQTYLKKKKTIEENKKLHYVYLRPKHMGFDNYLMENSIYNSIYSNNNKWLNDEYELMIKIKIWDKIRQLPPFQMRIMYYKYSSDFQKLRSNSAIAEIMKCSTGKVRMHLNKAKNNLLDWINDQPGFINTYKY